MRRTVKSLRQRRLSLVYHRRPGVSPSGLDAEGQPVRTEPAEATEGRQQSLF